MERWQPHAKKKAQFKTKDQNRPKNHRSQHSTTANPSSRSSTSRIQSSLTSTQTTITPSAETLLTASTQRATTTQSQSLTASEQTDTKEAESPKKTSKQNPTCPLSFKNQKRLIGSSQSTKVQSTHKQKAGRGLSI